MENITAMNVFYRCRNTSFKYLTGIIILCSLFLQTYAQQDTSSILNKVTIQQEFNSKFKYGDVVPKKRFWPASGELLLVELIPWSYNRYIRKAEFAKISFESIWHNMQFKNWEWDDNKFSTNQFAHPYHGNLYFSSFRSNGYSFWQSAPAALAGSYIWEVAGETHPAAPNDLINTTIGGITLGEMTFRVSNLIVNNKQRGFKRQVNEVLAFLVNPVNGFNRIVDGRWGKVMDNSPDRRPDMVTGEFDLGMRRFNERMDDDLLNKGKNEWYFRLKLQYGDPFKDRGKAFSNFNLTVEAGNNDSAKINALRVSGFLHGWRINDSSHALNLTTNYDYYHNSSFQYGAQSVNMNLFSKFQTGKKTRIETEAGAGIVILAAVPDEYLYYGEGRNYDYGPGFNLFAGGKLLVAEKLSFGLNYRGGWFATVNGNPSTHFLNSLTSELRYLFTKSISLGAEWGRMNLRGNYRDYDDVSRTFPYVRLSAGYKFGL